VANVLPTWLSRQGMIRRALWPDPDARRPYHLVFTDLQATSGPIRMKRCNHAPASPYTGMSNFNYRAPAELFGNPGRHRRSVSYRRFASGAEAVRFAVEGISDAHLAGVTLQVGDDRFDHRAIRALYDSAKYPLARQHPRAEEEGLQREPQAPVKRARATAAQAAQPESS
jgi:hypothetical protein